MNELIYLFVIVFLMGAAPWLEVWVAIPVGIALGLNPVIAFFAGVTGNFVPLAGIVFVYRRAQTWFKGRFSRGPTSAGYLSRRHRRFRELWNRYGLPVVSLVSPVVIGTHLATILAMIAGSPGKNVLIWMAVSLILWGVTTSIAVLYSVEVIKGLLIYWDIL